MEEPTVQQNSFWAINKKNLFIVLGIVVFLLLVLVVYTASNFRVTGVDPGQNATIQSLTKTVVFSFNKELSAFDRKTQIKGGEGIIAGSKVDGKKLFIQLKSMEDDQSYELVLVGVTATDGSTINEYNYKFKYAFDPQASAVTEKGNSDPLVANLPVSTDQYYISYELLDEPTADGKTEKLIIALLLTNEDLTNAQKVASFKKAALDFLDSKGIVISSYVIEFSPPEVE
jgi:hypothetical protein